jgi:hypothetical protein
MNASGGRDAGERSMSAFFGMIASEYREMFRTMARRVAAISTFGEKPR